ncbi:3-phosphoshikimate 1-carboxyvinyltransferase [Chloroflexus sp.]|uniref:3-phosphoshikimate 1-carboxyvinyltransferase n=1 Tax=Chloroflexus sp. TaxID=1904827 RepID=UPI002629FDFC|nr:3-phosphoshikimate 1-carboxyvinyltransferase [uncultured Chloroflexus sp.]
MTNITLTAPKRLRGVIHVPGDKSISHRAVLLNAVATGTAHITNFLPGADCLSSVACVRALGARVDQTGERELLVHGVGLNGFQEPVDVLDCGNSGTTLRLLAGLLAGQPFFSVLTGDASLRSRPQRRIVTPLRAMGAQIDGRADGDRAPLAIRGSSLRGGHYQLPIASAQVKSALLLAALNASEPLVLTGRIDSRDHTERMLAAMGLDITVTTDQIVLRPPTAATAPTALSLRVPGDPSSAAFWWVAAAIHPDAELMTPGVCLNPTRTGALDALRAMGATIEVMNERLEGSEPVGDVLVRSSMLRGTTIAGEMIPRLIDEIPVLAVAAACAEGETVIRDAQELRAKETDRIATVAAGLSAMGVAVEPTVDGMIIAGRSGILHGATLDSYHDHRLAMAWAIAALVARGETTILEPAAVAVSYPGFWQALAAVQEDA